MDLRNLWNQSEGFQNPLNSIEFTGPGGCLAPTPPPPEYASEQKFPCKIILHFFWFQNLKNTHFSVQVKPKTSKNQKVLGFFKPKSTYRKNLKNPNSLDFLGFYIRIFTYVIYVVLPILNTYFQVCVKPINS